MEKKQETQELHEHEKIVTIDEENEPIQVEEEQVKKEKESHDKTLNSEVTRLKEIVTQAYNEHEKLLERLSKSEKELINIEDTILNTTLKETFSLLKKLKIENMQELKNIAKNIAKENKEELLVITQPSKGRVKALFLATFAVLGSVALLGLYGAKLANLPLTPPTFMQKENFEKIAQSYLEYFHIQASPLAGEIALVAAALLVGVIVYKVSTFLKALKNRQEIKKLQAKSQEYIAKLEKKNAQINTILEQLEKVKSVTKKYDIILQEQNAKIKRMLFIEQPQSIEDLHKNSRLEVEKTILILDEFLKLMNTPVVKEEGVLNQDLSTNLKSANIVINEVIKNLY